MQNIVLRGNLGAKVDLPSLALELPDATYAPELFPGLIARIPLPGARALLFGSGKFIVVGLRSVPDAKRAFAHVRRLAWPASRTQNPDSEIVNCVATGSLDLEPNFERFLRSVGSTGDVECFQYNYDSPRSLIYHSPNGRTVVLLSRHGRITVVGAKSIPEIRECAREFLSGFGRLLIASCNRSGDRLNIDMVRVVQTKNSVLPA